MKLLPLLIVPFALAAGLIASGKATDALVTSVGHWRGEGALRVTKA